MAGAGDLRPLDAAIEEIRLLYEAAERAAARIGAEADRLTGRDATADAVAGDVAAALVGRTEAIREDCERLSALLQRARSALAAVPGPPVQDRASGPPEPTPSASPLPFPFDSPVPRAEAAAADLAEEPPVWQFWRRRRGERARPVATTPHLPRLDYSAMGVGPVAHQPDSSRRGDPAAPERVRVFAVQMATAGASRIEIASRLERQFGIADTEPVLNEVLGYDADAAVE